MLKTTQKRLRLVPSDKNYCDKFAFLITKQRVNRARRMKSFGFAAIYAVPCVYYTILVQVDTVTVILTLEYTISRKITEKFSVSGA